jgi:hypothetical protein
MTDDDRIAPHRKREYPRRLFMARHLELTDADLAALGDTASDPTRDRGDRLANPRRDRSHDGSMRPTLPPCRA